MLTFYLQDGTRIYVLENSQILTIKDTKITKNQTLNGEKYLLNDSVIILRCHWYVQSPKAISGHIL